MWFLFRMNSTALTIQIFIWMYYIKNNYLMNGALDESYFVLDLKVITNIKVNSPRFTLQMSELISL